MATNAIDPDQGDTSAGSASSLLATSAKGASLLIALQVGSRALTFLVNQVLLRFSSPELLGIATQLDLYSISVLFFVRESLRVALQRQADVEDVCQLEQEKSAPHGHVDGRTSAGRGQALVNLAYVSLSLGSLFAISFAWVYRRMLQAGDPTILQSPCFELSLALYALASFGELIAEPCFVVVQHKSRYKIRAAAESIATLLKCLMTCGTAIWAARSNHDIGVLPFALGQTVYAVSQLCVYLCSVGDIASSTGFSLKPKPIYAEYCSLRTD